MKLLPNEKIGLTCAVISWVAMFITIATGKIIFLLIQIVFIFPIPIFLSYWGLTTFNDKFKK